MRQMNRIKELRKQRGMTQDDLAEKLYVKRSVISKYENGSVPLTDNLILRLTNIFATSADYLLRKTDEEPSIKLAPKKEPSLQERKAQEAKDLIDSFSGEKLDSVLSILRSLVDVAS